MERGRRVRGYVADAAVVSERRFSDLRGAARGRTAHITFRARARIERRRVSGGCDRQVTHFFLNCEFCCAETAEGQPHPLYAHHPDPVPVSVTKISPRLGNARTHQTPKMQVELYCIHAGERRAD